MIWILAYRASKKVYLRMFHMREISVAILWTSGNSMSVLSSPTHPKMDALQIQQRREASPIRKIHLLAQPNASVGT